MNLDRIKKLIREHTTVPQIGFGIEELGAYSDHMAHEDIRSYLTECLPSEVYEASGVRVLTKEALDGENLGSGSPGKYLFPNGYVIIATSFGGNGICFDQATGKVFWADHTAFYNEKIVFMNPDTDEWYKGPLTKENIPNGLIAIGESIEEFMAALLAGDLEDRLDSLD